MTLKEELEILRGEPIEVFTGDPMEIPCIETSDSEKLCKNPVVSVHMITYNHEPYIRQAIEGVMMQKTDFEFELVIGEDCSQDKTREICFEYQKKYPDKIRVLWWHENVSKLGGNGRRVGARCRGKFVAICEGDDYWIDPLKLQKQVDVMRSRPYVSMCCHQFKVFANGEFSLWNEAKITTLINRGGDSYGFEFNKEDFFSPGIFAQTATILFRKDFLNKDFYEKLKRRCDISLFYACLKDHLGYFINNTMSVYRITNTGVWQGKSEHDRARWYFQMAHSMYEADPCSVTKRIYDDAVHKLRITSSPHRQLEWFRKWIRICLHNVKNVLISTCKR